VPKRGKRRKKKKREKGERALTEQSTYLPHVLVEEENIDQGVPCSETSEHADGQTGV
jgi:hypothetical protein